MPDAALTAELVFRGIAIGALATNGVTFFRAGVNRSMQIAGLIFFVSTISYVVNSSPHLREEFGSASVVFTLFSLGGGGFFWLFVVTLFEDLPINTVRLTPAAVLTGLGLVGLNVAPPLRNAVWVAHNFIEIGLFLHALYVIYESWRGDLIESRRRLRGPFLGFVTVYTIVMSGVEIGESVGIAASWYSLAGAVLLAIFCLAGCFMFLRVNPSLFGTWKPLPQPSPPSFDAAEQLELDRLEKTMALGAWRDENLTIGVLAQKVGVPEHRLRRLINDNLGHRNFAAYVNVRRIDAAKSKLSDPEFARTTVAAIAFELGFGSLGPFNKAFKEATGKTPTQWRRESLEKGSPNSEKPL